MTTEQAAWKLKDAERVYRVKCEVALGELLKVVAECARAEAEHAARTEVMAVLPSAWTESDSGTRTVSRKSGTMVPPNLGNVEGQP